VLPHREVREGVVMGLMGGEGRCVMDLLKLLVGEDGEGDERSLRDERPSVHTRIHLP
jgi:hypothetical protein